VAAKITAAQDRMAASPQGRELADDISCKMSVERDKPPALNATPAG
jgi:hypothetical protein